MSIRKIKCFLYNAVKFYKTYSSLPSLEYPANARHNPGGPSIARGKFCQVHSSTGKTMYHRIIWLNIYEEIYQRISNLSEDNQCAF